MNLGQLPPDEILKNRCSKYQFITMENKKLEEAAKKHSDLFSGGQFARTNAAFKAGAKWQEEQNLEIVEQRDELVNLLQNINLYLMRKTFLGATPYEKDLLNETKEALSKYNQK